MNNSKNPINNDKKPKLSNPNLNSKIKKASLWNRYKGIDKRQRIAIGIFGMVFGAVGMYFSSLLEKNEEFQKKLHQPSPVRIIRKTDVFEDKDNNDNKNNN